MSALSSKYGIATIHYIHGLYNEKDILLEPLAVQPRQFQTQHGNKIGHHSTQKHTDRYTLFPDLPLLFLPCWVQEQVPVPFFFLGHILIFFIVVGVLHVCFYLIHAIHATRGSASAAVASTTI